MAATKFYIGNAAASYAPSSVRGTWTAQDGSANTRQLARAATGIAGTYPVTKAGASGTWNELIARFISEPISATSFTTSDTVSHVMGAKTSSVTNSVHNFDLFIYVTQGESDTPRGTLLTNTVYATNWTTTAHGQAGGPTALTPTGGQVDALNGDRIVIEIGWTKTGTASQDRTGTLNYGYAGADLADGGTDVTTKAGWISFSNTVGIATREINVYDSVNVSEYQGGWYNDPVYVRESTTVALTSDVTPASIDVYDSITASESITAKASPLSIDVYDSITTVSQLSYNYIYKVNSNPLFATLIDDFDDNTADNAKWTYTNDANVQMVEADSKLKITVANNYEANFTNNVANRFNLTGSYTQFKFDTDTLAQDFNTQITLRDDIFDYTAIYFDINGESSLITAVIEDQVSPYAHYLNNSAYTPTTHKYLRFRENSGTIYWEYSADAVTWTELANYTPVEAARVHLIDLYFSLYTTNSSGVTKNIYLDDFNIRLVNVSDSVNVSEFKASDTSVPPACVLDQQATSPASGFSFGDANGVLYDYGQSFKPSISAELCNIAVKLARVGSPTDNLQCKLYSLTAEGIPDTLLATADNQIDGNNLSTTHAIYNFQFTSSHIVVHSANNYAFAISRTGSYNSSNLYSYIYGADSYANGDELYRDINGWSKATGMDTYFKTYYNNTTVVQEISVFDSINVSESITSQANPQAANVFDSITVSEDITTLEENLIISVFDSAIVSEDIIIIEANTAFSVFDSIAVTENVTSWNSSQTSDIYDSITTTEEVTTTTTTITNMSVDVFDSVTVNEDVTAIEKNLIVSISDNITITENIASQTSPQTINIFDSIVISEDITILEKNFIINVFDSITASEDIVSKASPQSVNVYDGVNVSENIVSWKNIQTFDIYDLITISESIASQANPQTLNVYDSINISEDITILEKNLIISVYDSITATEDITIIEKNLLANAFDTINISEDITIGLNPKSVNAFDSITTTEDIVIIEKNLVLNIFDSVTISENITSWESSQLSNVYDSINVSESSVVDKQIPVACVVDQQQIININYGTYFGYDAERREAQTFTPSVNAKICNFRVAIAKYTNTLTPTDNIQLDIYTTNAGKPDTLIGTADNVYPASALNEDTITYCNFNFFNTTNRLVPGTLYAAVLSRTGALTNTGYYKLYSSGSNDYADGAEYYDSSGTWTARSGYDFYFIEYYDNTTIAQEINVYDSITITEEVTAAAITIADRSINVFDSVTISEDITALEKNLIISIFDSIIAIENIASQASPQVTSIFDSITISEDLIILEKNLVVNVFNSITISENISSQASPQYVNVFDNITIAENITSQIVAQFVNVFDLLNVAEDISISIPSLKINIYDSIAVTENVTAFENKFLIDVVDSIGVSEDIVATTVSASSFSLFVYDSVNVNEYTAAYKFVGGRLFTSGFELNSNANGVEWDEIGVNTAIDAVTVHSGSYAIKSLKEGNGYIRKDLTGQPAGISYYRAYVNVVQHYPGDWHDLIAVGGLNDIHIVVDFCADRLKLYDYYNFVQLGSDVLIDHNKWYCLELKIDNRDFANYYAELRVDGLTVASGTTNLTATQDTNIAEAYFGCYGGWTTRAIEIYVDDVAINFDQGPYQNSWPGSAEVLHLQPNANTSYFSWLKANGDPGDANNYQEIDEVTPDDVTTYLKSKTQNHTDRYTFPDINIGASDTINAIHVGVRYSGESSSNNAPFQLDLSLLEDFYSSKIIPQSTTWITNSNTIPVDYPITVYDTDMAGTGITKAALDAATLDVYPTSNATNYTQISAIWLVVDYTPSLKIDVADTINVTEDTTVIEKNFTLSIFDNITISESVASQAFPLYINVVDNIVVSEDIVSKASPQVISVYDSISIAEDLASQSASQFTSIFDLIDISESTVIDIQPPTIPWSDNFNDNDINLTQWTKSSNVGSTVLEQNQRIELSSSASVSAYFRSRAAYSPQTTTLILQVTQHCEDGGFKLCPTDPAGHEWDIYLENNWYNLQMIAGNILSPCKRVNGVGPTQIGGDSPGLTAPFWMRIRIDDTSIYFDYVDNQATEPTDGQWINISSEVWSLGSAITDTHYAYVTAYNTPTTGALYTDNFSWKMFTAGPNVSDNISISEDLTLYTLPRKIDLFDSVTISENIVSQAFPQTINIYDNVNISENIIIGSTPKFINVYDSVNVSEDITTLEKNLIISVADAITTIEDIISRASPQSINVYDIIAVSEDIVTETTLKFISVADDITTTEDVNIYISLLQFSVVDIINVSENIAANIAILLIDVFDSITVAETVNNVIPVLHINVFDDLAIAEYITDSISILLINSYDAVNISESLTFTSALLTDNTNDIISGIQLV